MKCNNIIRIQYNEKGKKDILIMQEIKTVLDKTGNIYVPAEYQKMLGIGPGDEVIIKPGCSELRIIPSKQAVRRSQELVRKYIPSGLNLSENLISERRRESERE